MFVSRTRHLSKMVAGKNMKNGFTLIELLVVATILVLLVLIGISMFLNTQKSARDAKRQSDLTVIQNVLENYHTDQNYYPKDGDFVFGSPLKDPAGEKTYISSLPDDSSDVKYTYEPLPADCNNTAEFCTSYNLCGYLETSSGSGACGQEELNYIVTPQTLEGGTPAPTIVLPTSTPTPTITLAPSPTRIPTSTPTPTPTPTPTLQPAKRVFITSTTYQGDLGGLSGADQRCLDRANAANLCGGNCPAGSFKAWLSSSSVSARDRLSHNTGPYKLINGTILADSWQYLIDGSINTAIALTEINSPPPSGLVWTNTNTDGTLFGDNAQSCGSWTSTVGSGVVGNSYQSGTSWSNSGGTSLCSGYFPLYCFEQ